MSYSHNSNNPMVVLSNTADALLQQYESNSLTLEEYQAAITSQVIPQLEGLDKSVPIDEAMNKIQFAVAMAVGSVE